NRLSCRIPIRGGPRPTDGGLPRLGATAREHVFVSLPVRRVDVAGDCIFDRAFGEDVGAGRNLYGRRVGDVVERPAVTAKIPFEELIVVLSEFPDVSL